MAATPLSNFHSALQARDEAAAREQDEINRLRLAGEIRDAIERAADREHEGYPQYAGHWSGEKWQLGFITRLLRTKRRIAFRTGDVVLYHPGSPVDGDSAFATAYSVRNGVDTSLPVSHIEPLALEALAYRHPTGLVTFTGSAS